MVHHVITLTIVFASYCVHFHRVGAFVMVLHDFSDVFLEVAKCFNYSKDAHPKFAVGADVAFVVFAISFFYLRLYIYPTRVLTSAATQACEHVSCIEPPTFFNCAATTTYPFFLSLLGGLQLLQVFWGWKVLGVIGTVLSGKELEDPRDE